MYGVLYKWTGPAPPSAGVNLNFRDITITICSITDIRFMLEL
jgi:hypothetical protein